MSTDKPAPETDPRLKTALNDLDSRLKTARSDQAEAAKPARLMADGSAWAKGMKLVSEFVAGIIAGGLLGWIIDRVAGIAPFGLLIGLMFGFAAGLRNLYRATQRADQPPATPDKGPTG